METTVLRNAARANGKGYDPDLAYSMVHQLAAALKEGEYATLKHFKQDSRKVRRYLQAFEDIFVIQKLVPCSTAVGSAMWTFSDTGIASFVCGTARSAPVDFIWDGIAVKISASPPNQIECDMCSLRSAMAKLRSQNGILMTGHETLDTEKGIKIVPWIHCS